MVESSDAAVAPILIADDMEADTASGIQRSRMVEGYAGLLGAALKAPLLAVHVEKATLPSLASSQFFGQRARNTLTGMIRGGARETSRHVIVSGIPEREILKLAESRPRPILIAMGTRDHGGLKRLLLGSVAEKVIQGSRLPVLTLGPKITSLPSRNPFLPEERPALLVATDLSPAQKRVDAFALSLAKMLGARVTLFHSPFNDTKYYRALGTRFKESGELLRDVRAALENRTRRFSRHGVACQAALDTETTFISEAILKASRGHTGIIIGTHSRSPLTKAIIGSTARSIILQSPVPVFTLSLRI
ncbi:MAG: universal stress protein [Oligoflexia bacterium]|nr:universal stress protein [Oligoflexia bacterium]